MSAVAPARRSGFRTQSKQNIYFALFALTLLNTALSFHCFRVHVDSQVPPARSPLCPRPPKAAQKRPKGSKSNKGEPS